MATDHGLRGKTVLITGAAGGIGQALARAFAAQGVRLMLLDRVDATNTLDLIRQNQTNAVRTAPTTVRAEPAEALSAICDLGDASQVAAIAEQVRQHWGALDVLVNNAGTEYPTPLDDNAPDAMDRWASLLDNNVTSMVRLTQALLPLLPRGASVINQSSIWGRIGVAGFSAYAASKHAVVGLTRSLALELGPRGIRVNAVCPGWIRTEAALRSLTALALEQGLSEAEVEREILSRQAVPEMLTPADIAGVFLFLASTDARSLTGQCLVASHGEVMA
ncbi:SDR family NAD(P)-dependent oxidoreductase [Hydrogenophaga sp. PBL-H3]|uniref:SDR family NAD(P)-dependent oxidoreductase n=1 Tax=Hydrogenophaga sp. PBL-H3 TaxID=434010 RepID=UPI00131F887B|nr:SDR family oxidoreductase [Hydrogenophaga sp. PBL-H3]QHE75615.1 SDR family oxidoreductase [Hydrogenophaga sp. PBL-H3]QHE80041.1 SDR family oxidoreductase [Hydrogenophaga sp. PBL-H3]